MTVRPPSAAHGSLHGRRHISGCSLNTRSRCLKIIDNYRFDYTAQTRSLVESEYRSVFLKRFPRYAGRARRGATVAGDHLRGTAVVVENAPKLLSRHDGASVIRACRQRCEELVAETLVVPFCVIVHYVFGYRCAQVSLTERYEAVETLSTYGENESFRICVQIRTISGKAKGLHA